MATQTPSDDMIHAHNRKQRKVRNSCNACSSQKIRCGKERPKCHRCAMKRLECEYSISRRTGERPRVPASPPTMPESQGPTSLPIRDAPPSTMSNTPSISQLEQPSEQPVEQLSGLQDDISWMLCATPDLDMRVDQSLCFNTTVPHDFGSPMDSNDPTAPVNKLSGLIPTPPIQEYDLNYAFDQSHDHRPQPSDMPPRRSECTDSAHTSSSSYSENEIPHRRKIHDCTTEALDIVAGFHLLAQGCLTAAKDPACTMYSERSFDDTPREMGTVLLHNREALRKLNNLLDCRCSLRQEVLVLVYLAIHKAVSWYAATLDDDNVSQDDQSQPPFVGRIARTPSFMGSYCLDRQAQRLVSAHLVLTQLREHIDPLMKRLGLWHSSATSHSSLSTPSYSDSSSSSVSARTVRESSVIEHHHQALQDELNRITSKANSIKHI